jgi:hypothetical protein
VLLIPTALCSWLEQYRWDDLSVHQRRWSWSEAQPAGDNNREWYFCDVDDDGSVLLAAAFESRLYLSVNGGSSWSETQPLVLLTNTGVVGQ